MLINVAFPSRYLDEPGLPEWPCDLNSSNRAVRTRLPGGARLLFMNDFSTPLDRRQRR
jgi:hypothetical protein